MTGTPLADLLAAAGTDWQIGRALNMWTAEKHGSDGHHHSVRYIVAPTAAQLTEKILAAGEQEARQQQ